MSGHNFEALQRAVLRGSRANRWGRAVQEWRVSRLEEDPDAQGVCVCGKTGLVYLYTINNKDTANELFPIWSSCINLFDVEDLDRSVSVFRQLIELRAAFASGQPVDLTTDFFSRALLADLWENGAFPPNEFNHESGDNDYRFLLNLFNRRRDSTDREQRKVWVLINRTIRPFVLSDDRLG